MDVKLPSAALIGPHVPVDCFVTYRELSKAPEVATDLLGTPFQDEQHIHERVLFRCVMPHAARTPASAISPLLGLAVAVVPVVDAAVTRNLSGDCAPMPAKDSSDGSRTKAFLSKQRDRIPLFRGELVIRHG